MEVETAPECPDLVRSPSTASTLSCINVAAEEERSSAPSSTPPTSVTDAGSISSGKTGSMSAPPLGNGRVRRVRSGVASYNENDLSGSSRRASKALRNASGNPLVGGNASRDQLLSKALDLSWEVGNMPGDTIEVVINASGSGAAQAGRGGSTLGRLSKTASVLGKRSRNAFESGKGKIQRAGKRSSKRLRTIKTAKEPEPAPKSTRLAETQAKEQKEEEEAQKEKPKPMRPRAADKKFLGQGLYVGQDPASDPRFTVEKNKRRRSQLGLDFSKLPTILPPPMFAGKRLLEQGRGFRLPYSIFNPLPDRQPKPDEWRKTRKNLFVGDAGDLWKSSKQLEQSACMCEPENGCGEDCMNRYMFYECDDGNCRLGPERCTNRAFADLKARTKAGGKYRIGVEVIKTKDRGYGVRSNRCFDPGQIIVEYTGEIITQEECDDRMESRYKNNECFYLMEFDQNMIIDATRGSIARFVNHACEPNCKMVKWTVAGKPRMALFAGERPIMTGEELSYDYNFDPFSSKNIQECRCGSVACRGVLGPRVSKDKEPKDALAPLTKPTSAKRKIGRAAAGSVAAVKRRKVAGTAAGKAATKAVRKAAGKAGTKAGRKVAATKVRRAVTKAVARGAPKVAASGRRVAAAAKRGAAKQVARARIVVNSATASSPADKARLVKKMSEKSLRVPAGVTVKKVGTVSGNKRQTTLAFTSVRA